MEKVELPQDGSNRPKVKFLHTLLHAPVYTFPKQNMFVEHPFPDLVSALLL